MQISCPRCQKQFVVPDSAIPPTGRLVKCSDCQFTWNALPESAPKIEETPPNATIATDSTSFAEDRSFTENNAFSDDPNSFSPFAKPLPDSEELEEDRHKQHEERRKKTKKKPIPSSRKSGAFSAFLSWVFVFALIGSGLWGTYHWRAQIIDYYPPAANVYQQFGLWQIPGYGMEISIPSTKATRDAQGHISLQVSGLITNNNEKVVPMPSLKGVLKDDQGKTLYIWTFDLPEKTIAPGANIPYQTEVKNPPLNTQSLTVSFISQKEKDLINKEWHSKITTSTPTPKQQTENESAQQKQKKESAPAPNTTKKGE